MKLVDSISPSFEIDTFHTIVHLISIGMTRLDNHHLNYLVFEKNEKVYYFEELEGDFLRLFCVTTRKSFYL